MGVGGRAEITVGDGGVCAADVLSEDVLGGARTD